MYVSYVYLSLMYGLKLYSATVAYDFVVGVVYSLKSNWNIKTAIDV